MAKNRLESLRADHEIMEELQDLMHSRSGLPRAKEAPGGKKSVATALESVESRPASVYDTDQSIAEAIILMTGRPSLLVRDGTFDKPETATWQKRLAPHRALLEQGIPSVGRVELLYHPDFEWVGTAWMVADDVLVTNRHVAELFCERRGGQFPFARNLAGQTIDARVDFREEYQRSQAFEIKVRQVLYVSPAGRLHPDIAFMRIERNDELPPPIPLATRNPRARELVCVVGYPARDSRNAAPVMSQIFADIFDVKRLAPGYVMELPGAGTFTHDCTTLGGNSGSVIFTVASGEAVGLHFAGRFAEANYAVDVSTIKQVLAQMNGFAVAVDVIPEADRRRPEDYADRKGYQEGFLGDAHHVSLPDLTTPIRHDTVVVNADARSIGRYVLDYTHFSVVMSRAHRLARYTAVNIDGSQEVVVRRRNTGWRLDPRLELEHQTGNALYHGNRLDRGHLVRRLDPVWGSDDEAKQAEEDTFHYTNAAPQHEQLNQKSWLKLEDYLLENTNNRDLKLTVFTGPIFQEDDPLYRGVQIPQAYWKVAVMVTQEGELHATAYKLGQAQFLDDIEFAFGAFGTFQVPVRTLEEETGLSFGNLADFDPLDKLEGIAYQPIRGPEDIIM